MSSNAGLRRGRYVTWAVLTVAVVLAFTGCSKPEVLGGGLSNSIPKDASRADFCRAGENFSALKDVPFSEGEAAAKVLEETGTPDDIDKSARAGFVELVQRMNDSDDAGEFLRKSQNLGTKAAQNRTALTVYIQLTCMLANASTADFCTAGESFAAVRNGKFEDRKSALQALLRVGAPPDISPDARQGVIELMDRMSEASSNEELDKLTRQLDADQREHLVALDEFIKRAC